MKKFSTSKGFTLIELLVVITIITALGVAVFVALNPAQRLADARNARRTTDVDTILSAIHQYIVDEGSAPTGLSTTEKQLGTAATGCAIATGGCAVAGAADCLDITAPLASYLKSIPADPNGTASLTGYSAVQDANGIVTIKACAAESTTISASR
ncbi:MAG: type II secretion system protein [Candidatus Levybacteria bacterium]|nr:type II secretion system protein [Candidatus Levybacteria bacterium]